MCKFFSQSLRQSLRERTGVDTNIVGVGGTKTRRLQERAVLEHAGCRSARYWNTQVAGARGIGTRRLQERAVLEHAGCRSARYWNTQVAGAGGPGQKFSFKKTAPCRALLWTTKPVIFLKLRFIHHLKTE